MQNIKEEVFSIISSLGINLDYHLGHDLNVFSPIDGSFLCSLRYHTEEEIEDKIEKAVDAFSEWRNVPAPKRGALIQIFGSYLRKYKEPLAKLVSIESGKILEEGRGEVQEMIDICDFAVGLSRQLYGLTIASERKNHVMHENWLPLGPVGIISAFNFPVAVWAWNSVLAIVCGDSVVWKPSEKTPLTALACQTLFDHAFLKFTQDTGISISCSLSSVILGDAKAGQLIVDDKSFPLISATGSTRMGSIVGQKVAARFGRSLLELGGNNAVILSQLADLKSAYSSILFGAIGTAGQRCTTTRRLFVHKSIYDGIKTNFLNMYKSLNKVVGSPFESSSLLGPLIDKASFDNMQRSLIIAREDFGEQNVHFGNRILEGSFPGGYYVHPALVFADRQTQIIKEETFAPILYIMPYRDLEDAIEMNNDVPQGLSSAIFTKDLSEAEIFKKYSDCGIANINIGTSGAEIGGAFGGEKETGGGRESGSDSWKVYMRRQTTTTYYGREAPELAQGIKFNTK